MADFQKLLSKLGVTAYDFDPGGTDATDVGWIDGRDVHNFAVGCVRTIGTSDLTFTIIGNTEADGSGTDTTIKSVTLAAQPDAVGDLVVAEVTRDDIMQAASTAGVDIRGLSAQLTVATGTDELVVFYITEGKFSYLDKTADVVA